MAAFQSTALAACRAGPTLRPCGSIPAVRHRATAAAIRAPRRGGAVAVRAMQSGKGSNGGPEGLRDGVQNMLAKYDFLSTGMGALCVTTYCVVYRHQDPLTALQITASSIVMGLVLNEVFFENEEQL